MSKTVHFEFSTPDPDKEIDFFTTLFDWKAEKWADFDYWVLESGDEEPGINGAITLQNGPDHPRVLNTIGVEDIDATIEKAVEKGATIALEAQVMPGVGKVANLVSPTGIMFSLIEPEPGSM